MGNFKINYNICNKSYTLSYVDKSATTLLETGNNIDLDDISKYLMSIKKGIKATIILKQGERIINLKTREVLMIKKIKCLEIYTELILLYKVPIEYERQMMRNFLNIELEEIIKDQFYIKKANSIDEIKKNKEVVVTIKKLKYSVRLYFYFHKKYKRMKQILEDCSSYDYKQNIGYIDVPLSFIINDEVKRLILSVDDTIWEYNSRSLKQLRYQLCKMLDKYKFMED